MPTWLNTPKLFLNLVNLSTDLATRKCVSERPNETISPPIGADWHRPGGERMTLRVADAFLPR